MTDKDKQDQAKAEDNTFDCNPDNDVSSELDELVHKVAVQHHIEELLDLDEDTLDLDVRGDRYLSWIELHAVMHTIMRLIVDHMQIKNIIRDSQMRELKAVLGPIFGDKL